MLEAFDPWSPDGRLEWKKGFDIVLALFMQFGDREIRILRESRRFRRLNGEQTDNLESFLRGSECGLWGFVALRTSSISLWNSLGFCFLCSLFGGKFALVEGLLCHHQI